MKRFTYIVLALLFCSSLFADEYCPPKALNFSKVKDFPANVKGDQSAANPGNLDMYIHVPSDLPQHSPIVVALHGCGQSAGVYDDQAEWTKLANRFKFILIMPEQKYGSDRNKENINNALKCFNWNGTYGHYWARGEGESESIAQMVSLIKTRYSIDDERVFITGLSAGASMAVMVCAQYPDIFSACGFVAAAPYLCGNPFNEVGEIVRERAFKCLGVNDDLSYSPRTQGACKSNVACSSPDFLSVIPKVVPLVKEKGYFQHARWPRVMIWQGDEDELIDPRLANVLKDQWLFAHNLQEHTPKTITLNNTSSSYVAKEYGTQAVVQVTMRGMKHGISVDPGKGPEQGGVVDNNFWAGGYSYDLNVYSSYEIIEFFGLTAPLPPTPKCSK